MKKSLFLLAVVLISAGLVACGDGPGTGITSTDGATGAYTGPTGSAQITEGNADDIVDAMRFSSAMLPFFAYSQIDRGFDTQTRALSPKEMPQYLSMALADMAKVLPLHDGGNLGITKTWGGGQESPYGGSYLWSITGVYPNEPPEYPVGEESYPPYRADATITATNLRLYAEDGPVINGTARLVIELDEEWVDQRQGEDDLITVGALQTGRAAAVRFPDIPIVSFRATVNQFSIYHPTMVNVLFSGLLAFKNETTEQFPVNYTIDTGLDFTDVNSGFSFRDQSSTTLKIGYSSPPLIPALMDQAAEVSKPSLDVFLFTSMGKLWSTQIGGAVSYAFAVNLGGQNGPSVSCEITGLGGAKLTMLLNFEIFMEYQQQDPGSRKVPVKVMYDVDGDGTPEYEIVRALFDFSGVIPPPRPIPPGIPGGIALPGGEL